MIKNVISFSGGATSAFMVLEVKKLHTDAEVIYMDTGAEHPDTYRFIRSFSSHFKINITCLRLVNGDMGKGCNYEVISIDDIGQNYVAWERMLSKYGHPYVGGAFCTDRMKTKPFKKYCDDKYGKKGYKTWLGIRIDEPNRLKEKDGFDYLASISDFDKQDIKDFWSDYDFKLRIPEHLGNCVFCIKKSNLKVALATKDEPVMASNFIKVIDEHDKKSDRVMYRGNQSLVDVIAMFKETERNEIASRVSSARLFDAGSCSESCEAFSNE